MKTFNPNKEIRNASDLEEYCNGMLEGFLASIHDGEGKWTRPVREDDCVDDDFDFMYTRKGSRLAERMKDRLIKVCDVHYPNEEFSIESYFYKES